MDEGGPRARELEGVSAGGDASASDERDGGRQARAEGPYGGERCCFQRGTGEAAGLDLCSCRNEGFVVSVRVQLGKRSGMVWEGY